MYVLVPFMPPSPQSTEPSATDRQTDAHYYQGVLHELIDMGVDLARLVHTRAHSQSTTAPDLADPASANDDPTVAFDRIARCIRRSIALARCLADPAPLDSDVVQHRVAARKRIIRGVEDAIQREAGEADAGALQAELSDRLDEPDLDDDIDHRPVADIIADICHDLGIAASPGTHPWRRRTPADIAALHARATQPYTTTPASEPADTPTVLLYRTRFRGRPK